MSLVKEYQKTLRSKEPQKPTKGSSTLKEQQDYYRSLVKDGIARPDTYNIKPISNFS